MTITITTPPSATANSYLTTSEADLFSHEHEFGDDWRNADTNERNLALITCTRLIDARDWHGSATHPDIQDNALNWPRYGIVIRGYEIDSSTLPTQLKRAVAVAAFHWIKVRKDWEEYEAENHVNSEDFPMSSIKVGNLQVDWDTSEETNDSDAPLKPSEYRVPKEVLILLRPFTNVGATKLRMCR